MSRSTEDRSNIIYPAPRNQKHLRQLLGTYGFHNKFVANYADYVAPLSATLKKEKVQIEMDSSLRAGV
jgi:hypothetical protein